MKANEIPVWNQRWRVIDNPQLSPTGYRVEGPSIWAEEEEVIGCSEWMRVDGGVLEYIVGLHNNSLKLANPQETTEKPTHALFMGYFCYPKGGRNDLEAFGTPEQLVEIYANYFTKPSVEPQECWGHIVDLHTMQIVMEIEGGTVWQVVKAGV